MRLRSGAAALLLCGAALVGCTAASGERPGADSQFRIVGYMTAAAVVDVIDFSRLTHVNYAFLLPKRSGELKPFGSPTQLRRVVEQAHTADTKVLISVGGWGSDDEFEALEAAEERRARFVAAVAEFVAAYQLDGVDIDWEYPDAGASGENFLALMRDLRAALPGGRLLTAAVIADATHADGIDPAVFELIDFANIMAYDGGAADHSSLQLAERALATWDDAGLVREKRVLGVPFYARPGGIPYRALLASDPAAANGDRVTYLTEDRYYNGPATLRAKVALATAEASGVMIWELSQDALGSDSLLDVIWNAR